jgi:hypothetical protein
MQRLLGNLSTLQFVGYTELAAHATLLPPSPSGIRSPAPDPGRPLVDLESALSSPKGCFRATAMSLQGRNYTFDLVAGPQPAVSCGSRLY